MSPEGSIVVEHNAPDLGEGSHTILQIIAAKSLNVPLEMVEVAEPDSGNGLFFTGVSSQRTTVQMGTAVSEAAAELRQRMLAAAARLQESSAERWSLADGRIVGPDGFSMSLAELAGNLRPGETLSGRGSFETAAAAEGKRRGRDHWTAGAAAVEVEVDLETGQVRLLRYAAVADAGTALHYPSAKGQVEGGGVLGLGLALFEEMLYQDGQLQNADVFQYRLPLMRDLPTEWVTTIIEMGDGPGPFGSKAMAQTSVPCATPAICNAIYDATGARLTESPFTPERVLRALGRVGS